MRHASRHWRIVRRAGSPLSARSGGRNEKSCPGLFLSDNVYLCDVVVSADLIA